MTKKTQTIDLKGKAYATVPARIKEFRQDCPNGLIETKPVIQADGQVIFSARILKDKANESSAEATGHSIGKLAGDKAFEKLETIAIGRALAILGYLSSGDIASGEEMERFYEYRDQKKADAIQLMKGVKTLDELKQTYLSLGSLMAEPELIKLKDQLKLTLK